MLAAPCLSKGHHTRPAAGTAPSEGHCVNNKHGAEGAVRIPDGQKGGLRSRAKKDPGWGHYANCEEEPSAKSQTVFGVSEWTICPLGREN